MPDPSTRQPTLADGVVIVRPWRLTDAGWVCDICQDPEVQRWTTVPTPYTRRDAEHFVGELAPATWAEGSAAHFAVVAEADGSGLGAVGLVAIDRRTRTGAIGYHLGPAARGRGAATRSVLLVAGWAWTSLGLERLEVHIDPRNAASIRVAELAGAVLERHLERGTDPRAERHDTLVFVLAP